jgi:putative ABC transport system ATP-binding protein
MIQLTNIHKTYNNEAAATVALTGINLTVKKGEVLAITGPSGSGKSTLLHLLGLLDDPSGGEIRLDGCLLSGKTERELALFRNQKIGFIFQSYHLIHDLPVIDNVEMPLLYRANLSRGQRRKLAQDALANVGLSDKAKHYPRQLSGGQQQRVAIARAVAGGPELLLADEPTGSLDRANGDDIVNLMLELNRSAQTTLVIVTHDMALAEMLPRQVKVVDGQIIYDSLC